MGSEERLGRRDVVKRETTAGPEVIDTVIDIVQRYGADLTNMVDDRSGVEVVIAKDLHRVST